MSHTYGSEGTFDVILTVVDDEDEIDADTTTVEVGPPGTGGGGSSETPFGGWTDPSGNPVDSIGVGDTAILELCGPEQTQAFQASLMIDGSLGSIVVTNGDFDAANANTSTCSGQGDVVDQFTLALNVEPDSVRFQTFSIAAGAGSGPQGYAIATLTANAAGIVAPVYTSVVYSTFDGSAEPNWVLPPLAIDVTPDTAAPPPPPPPVTPPTADAGGPYADTTGAVISFTGTASGDVDSVLWDFGDGDSATTPSATNVYDTAGVYTATFTATGPGGSTTDSVEVTISDPAPPPPPPPPTAQPFAWKNEWTPANGNPAQLVTLSVWTNPGEPMQVVFANVSVDPLALELVSATPGDAFSGQNGGLFGNVLPASDGVVRINARAGSVQPAGVPVLIGAFTYRVLGSLGTSAATMTDSLRIGVTSPFLDLSGLDVTEAIFDIGPPQPAAGRPGIFVRRLGTRGRHSSILRRRIAGPGRHSDVVLVGLR